MKIYVLHFHKQFQKDYRKLTKKVRRQFEIKKDLLITNLNDSTLNLHPLRGDWRGHWSINITGDIRAIFQCRGQIAIFVNIGTHSELYE